MHTFLPPPTTPTDTTTATAVSSSTERVDGAPVEHPCGASHDTGRG